MVETEKRSMRVRRRGVGMDGDEVLAALEMRYQLAGLEMRVDILNGSP